MQCCVNERLVSSDLKDVVLAADNDERDVQNVELVNVDMRLDSFHR